MMMMGLGERRHLAAFAVIIFALQATQTAAAAAAAAQLKLGKEKVSHLHFYFHDSISGKNVSAVRVAASPLSNASATLFGVVFVMDDPLTEGPDPSSKVVGRAQGLYGSAGQQDLHLLMVVTYVFQSGELNGSTLSVVGNNAVFSKVREMPIVGGSGKFRLARGYALAQTHSFDANTANAIVQYNVTVLHY